VLRFRIYYADGSIYSDSDGSPFDAPGGNALVIAQENHAHGRVILASPFKGYFCWSGAEWWECDAFGFMQYMLAKGERKVVFGTNAYDAVYNAAVARAVADDYLPRKSAMRQGESCSVSL
jgi:hypothetical protein